MKDKKGFTIIELLVAVFVAGIVMAGVYSAYYSQQKSYTAQEQIAEMQQNLRAAMYIMAREIRMAGCNPKRNLTCGAGFQTINTDEIAFTMDIRGQAATDEPDEDVNDPDENITYSLAGGRLIRSTPQTQAEADLAIAENIDELDFVYLDRDNLVTTDHLEVRSVQITLVARTGREDPGFSNSTVYKNLQGTTVYTAPGDSFRRKVLSTHIKCRNMGI